MENPIRDGFNFHVGSTWQKPEQSPQAVVFLGKEV